jgi:hypothetical protein
MDKGFDMSINVYELIGKTAVSRESGLTVKREIDLSLKKNGIAILEFKEVEIYASPFFNTSIAPYLEFMGIDELKKSFKFENISPLGRSLLNQVIHNAIDFYSKTEHDRSKIQDKIDNGLE